MRRLARSIASILLLLAGGCASEPLGQQSGQEASAGGSSASGAGPSEAVGPPSFALADYPAGPYGTERGSVIDNFAFLGWREPLVAGYNVDALETVRLSDFYNPSGSETGPRFLVINASAVWCVVCRAEYQHMKENNIYPTYRDKGIQIIGTLFEDANSGPARPSDLKAWGELATHSVEFPLVLDPGNKLGVFFSSDATPLNLLVDARTMVVVNVSMGYSSDYWELIDRALETL